MDKKETIIEMIMAKRNPQGLNLLELCCSILFEKKDERFLFCLLDKVPDVVKYLHTKNDKGSLPLFRVIHVFQNKIYESK